MFENVDFAPGKVVYNDFDIDPNKLLEEQLLSLKEDMLQVSYDDKYLIDIGWSPEFDIKGKFKVRIIENYNWLSPLYFKRTSSLSLLSKYVKECAEILKNYTR